MKTLTEQLTKWFFTIVLVLVVVQTIFAAIGNIKIVGGWPFPVPPPVVVDDLDDEISQKTKGKLTVPEINQFLEDQDLPIADDIFTSWAVRETANYVVLYRGSVNLVGAPILPNLSFLKTSDGLVFDGMWGVTVDKGADWWNGGYYWDRAQINYAFNDQAYNANIKNIWQKILIQGVVGWIGVLPGIFFGSSLAWSDWENIVTFSDFNPNFVKDYRNHGAIYLPFIDWNARLNDLYNFTRRHIVDDVMTTHYINLLPDVFMPRFEGEDADKQALGYINSLATHLYRQSKTVNNSQGTSLVDISHYFNKYVSDDDLHKFPIPEEKEADFNGDEFYPIYRAKVIAEVSYSYNDAQIKRNQDTIVQNVESSKQIVAETPVVESKILKLNLKLQNSNNSDLSQFKIEEKPVIITIGDRVVRFETLTDLQKGKTIVVPQKQSLNYAITSPANGLVFNAYSGTIITTTSDAEKAFEFTYTHNVIPVSARLIPTGTVDLSAVNLTTNPVVVSMIGTTKEGTFQFVFNSNEKLTGAENINMPLGVYNYTISSSQLSFTEPTGQITVSAQERMFNFTYYVQTNGQASSDWTLSSNLDDRGSDASISKNFSFRISAADLERIKQTARSIQSGGMSAEVKISFYDGSDLVLERNVVRITEDYLNGQSYYAEFEEQRLEGGKAYTVVMTITYIESIASVRKIETSDPLQIQWQDFIKSGGTTYTGLNRFWIESK